MLQGRARSANSASVRPTTVRMSDASLPLGLRSRNGLNNAGYIRRRRMTSRFILYLARLGVAVILLVSVSPTIQAENPRWPLAMSNDNRTASGKLKNGVLKLEL